MDMKEFMNIWVSPKELNSTGDLAVILNEGERKESKWNKEVKRPVFLIEHNKEQKYITMNRNSVKELVKEYGPDSQLWIGKVVLLLPINISVGGEIKTSVIVKPHRGPTPTI